MTEYEQQRIALANQITGAVNQLWLSGLQTGDPSCFNAAQSELRARKLRPTEVLMSMGLSEGVAKTASSWLENSGFCFLVFESSDPLMAQFFPPGQMTRVKVSEYRQIVSEVFAIRRSVLEYLTEQRKAMMSASP